MFYAMIRLYGIRFELQDKISKLNYAENVNEQEIISEIKEETYLKLKSIQDAIDILEDEYGGI